MYSPIQRDRYSSQPSPQHRADQPAIDLVNWQQERNNLPPRLAIHTMYVYKRECAKERNVGAAEQGV